MRDPETLPYTTYRISLLSGVLGSVAATLGWLLWLAARMGDTKMILTIVVGAVLGLAVEWTQHYVKVARRERQGEIAAHPHLGRPITAIAYAGAFGFLGLVAEHLVAHMAGEFLVPFLASLTTLLPAGLILGWTMSRGEEQDENLVMMIANGMLIGVSIAVVTGCLWLLAFKTADWLALFSWWGLIGIGTRMVARRGRHAVSSEDPVVAVVLIFILTLLINLLPMTQSTYARFGPFGSIAMRVRAMAAEIEMSPAVPESFWKQAEQDYLIARAKEGDTTAHPVVPPTPRPILAPSPAPAHIDITGAVDRLTAPEKLEAPQAHWNKATWLEFVRSWLVILFFAIGIGWAPAVERALRPVDYPNSETYRRDLLLTVAVVLIVSVSCVVARVDSARKAVAAAATTAGGRR